MATMIPTDSYFDPSSGEKKMYDALKKLPSEYFVFHSYRLVQLIPDKGLNENEIDFLVFHPLHGCLFIECKNSKIARTYNGDWKYVKEVNGIIEEKPMKDPFNQAFSGQHNLFNKLKETYPQYRDVINRCKFLVAVWLPKYTKDEIENSNFGPNITKEIILTREAVITPGETLAQIQALMERMNKVHLVCKFEEEQLVDNGPGYKHSLSHTEAMDLYKNVLCPTFRAIVNSKIDYENTYIELLEEQYVVLDYLAHQRTAAISGASGTGKTMVALERARRLSNKEERVLFLCYNRNLRDVLEKVYKSDMTNVDFYTLDSFGCSKCNVQLDQLSYFDLKDVLEEEILSGSFVYKHVIVDEGQDFGKRKIEESDIRSDILELLAGYGNGDFGNNDTSFFIFYDKNQLVNTKILPDYLQNVDSKLTLYKNCRNTKNIASTAYSLLSVSPQMSDRAWNGEIANFIFYSNKEELNKKLDAVIDDLSKDGETDRVIISCSDSLKYSAIYEFTKEDSDKRHLYYKSSGKKTRVYTCPTFKGLEADAVLITDLSSKQFNKENFDFYVAASRARKRLFIFADATKLNVEEILKERFPDGYPLKNKEKQLALAMHACLR